MLKTLKTRFEKMPIRSEILYPLYFLHKFLLHNTKLPSEKYILFFEAGAAYIKIVSAVFGKVQLRLEKIAVLFDVLNRLFNGPKQLPKLSLTMPKDSLTKPKISLRKPKDSLKRLKISHTMPELSLNERKLSRIMHQISLNFPKLSQTKPKLSGTKAEYSLSMPEYNRTAEGEDRTKQTTDQIMRKEDRKGNKLYQNTKSFNKTK